MLRWLCILSVVACLLMIVANVEPNTPVIWSLDRDHGMHLFDLFPLALSVTAFGLTLREGRRAKR